MYQIKCDDYILYDPRIENLTVLNPKCELKVNGAGGLSFTILPNHPYYHTLQKLKSVIELWQDSEVIFRGRIISDERDLYNRVDVECEGALAFTNDTLIPPFDFPMDFPNVTGNAVEYFLSWILDNHNKYVQDWQKLKLGQVTVEDPNNAIARSNSEYASTWDTLKTKLFESGLGGYLCVRYEEDGNYIDYLSNFEFTNTQKITFGENLLDITNSADATLTYTAIMPTGAEIEQEDGTKIKIDLATLPDGYINDDLVKVGLHIYSRSGVDTYGWICVPVSESKWEDVTEPANLQTKACNYLVENALKLSNSITFKALDLGLTDSNTEHFRIARNVVADSKAHGLTKSTFPLVEMSIDIPNPQNSTITLNKNIRSLTDVNEKDKSDAIQRVESATKDIKDNVAEINTVKNQLVIQSTQIINDCNEIILQALESYVESSDYEEFKETTQAALKIMSDEIVANFTTTTKATEAVNSELQSKFTELYKYIKFSGETAISIGSGNSAITLEIDNEKGIVFKKNGVQFGLWDGVDFYTGNIIVNVNERAQFGNFAFIPRSDGSLSFLKVGG